MKIELKFKMKNVIGYENLYTIYRDGRIFGKKREKFLTPNISTTGYYQVILHKNGKGKTFTIHRLLAIHFIDNPLNLPSVDHISGDKSNNYIDNLRWANQSKQRMNTGMQSNNTSGFKGVYLNKRHGKWKAQIQIDGKNKHLGTFDTAEEAHEVREAEEIKLFGEFRRQIVRFD